MSIFTPLTWSLSGFSRACPFADIPLATQPLAIQVFDILGTGAMGKFNFLYKLSDGEKYKYFINESLTADYGSNRYYLYAENVVYRYYDAQQKYIKEGGYKSDGWRADNMDERVLSTNADFFKNRGLGIFSNARAGHPEIIQYWAPTPPGPGRPRAYRDFFVVVGQHSYYDHVGKIITNLRESRAYDCNLFQWGIDWR